MRWKEYLLIVLFLVVVVFFNLATNTGELSIAGKTYGWVPETTED